MGADDMDEDDFLDRDFVIGVWASASRTQIRSLRRDGSAPIESGTYIQVSRLGMPLTNEVIIPIGEKDRWNTRRRTAPTSRASPSTSSTPSSRSTWGTGCSATPCRA